MKTICLVGNGNQVLESHLGKDIDNFDTVVRFNNFQISGYEQQIGTKTDWWSTRICTTIKQRDPKAFTRIFGVCNWCKFLKQIIGIIPSFQVKYPKIELISFNECKSYSDVFQYNQYKNWLSVGIITLMHLLDEGHTPIHIVGFGGDPAQHYFSKPPQDFRYHDFLKEQQYIEGLVADGKVIRL